MIDRENFKREYLRILCQGDLEELQPLIEAAMHSEKLEQAMMEVTHEYLAMYGGYHRPPDTRERVRRIVRDVFGDRPGDK